MAGRLGAAGRAGCAYRHGKKNCAVGCFFNKAQLDDIGKRLLNIRTPVRVLALRIGKENIEHVTGLELDELAELQLRHDRDADSGLFVTRSMGSNFAAYVRSRIAYWSKK